MSAPVIRVSILTVPPEQLDAVERLMVEAEPGLRGIKALPGQLAYFAGIDRATSRLTNVSVWRSVAEAEAMNQFEPMLELGRKCAALGCTFLRPIPNFTTLWQWGDVEPNAP